MGCIPCAGRALQAALAMRAGLAYLNSKRETLNRPTLKFGMGLNSGEVVAGATGSEERQEYTLSPNFAPGRYRRLGDTEGWEIPKVGTAVALPSQAAAVQLRRKLRKIG